MILYGAGGHAHVVYEGLGSSGLVVKGVIDDDPKKELFNGLSVCHSYSPKFLKKEKIIIAIGSNHLRSKLAGKVKHAFGICQDITSHVSHSASFGLGTVFLTKSVVQAGCKIGCHVIINTGAIIEHDCRIGDFAHIGPGSVICGGANIGAGALIGANVTLLPGIKIGDGAIVGAGSVVLQDVNSDLKVAGNPAQEI